VDEASTLPRDEAGADQQQAENSAGDRQGEDGLLVGHAGALFIQLAARAPSMPNAFIRTLITDFSGSDT